MKRLALGGLLAAWALLAIVAWRAEDRAAAESGPPLSDNRYQIADSGRYVVVGVILYDKQEMREVYVYNASGYPTATPSATVETATPSATPPPTNTPTPTNTPRPSSTPGVPTPTPESTVLPTLPPDGHDKLCLVKVGASAVNERTAPSTSAPKTATSPVPAASPVKLLEVREAEGYLWGRSALGWFVIRQGASWWVYGIEGATELCDEVDGWPEGLEPPAPIARTEFGLWVGPGADLGELITFGQMLKAAGRTPAATVYGNDQAARALYGEGWTVALRPWIGDCPATWDGAPDANARTWVNRAVDATAGVPRHWLVLSNECGGWPSLDYARDWIAAALDQAARRGVRAAVPVVWNSGAPELHWVPALAPVYHAAPVAAAWGVNVYPVTRGVALAERSLGTLWTTWRWQMYRDALGGLPLIATEAARGDGSERAEISDLGRWAREVDGVFAWATFWYAAMPLGNWGVATLRGRLGELAQALVG